MRIEQWILFFAGLAVIFVGVCLMAYSVAAKGAFAGKKTKESSVAQIIEALGGILKILGDWFGANMAGKVGFVLILCGFGLLYFSFRIA
jgi:hypothetical protein